MVRLPRNEVLDTLFDLFKEKCRWSAKDLREATQQPEAYLKELLPVMAFSHRKGEFRYLWELKPEFAVKAEHGVLVCVSKSQLCSFKLPFDFLTNFELILLDQGLEFKVSLE